MPLAPHPSWKSPCAQRLVRPMSTVTDPTNAPSVTAGAASGTSHSARQRPGIRGLSRDEARGQSESIRRRNLCADWRWPETENPKECLARAMHARAAAKTEVLENVREKHLAAAKAWELLATQVSRIIQARLERQLVQGAGRSTASRTGHPVLTDLNAASLVGRRSCSQPEEGSAGRG